MRDHLEALTDHAERFGSTIDHTAPVEFDALDAEWRDALDRLAWLHERFEHRELSPEHAAAHLHNLALLKKQMPILVKLGLAVPTGALAAWLASPDAAEAMAELI